MPTSSPERHEACRGRRRALRIGSAAFGAALLPALAAGGPAPAALGAPGTPGTAAAPGVSGSPAAHAVSGSPGSPGSPAVTLPAVTLLDGSRYQPDTGRGSALIVVFWSIDCPFCRNDNPHVEKLHRAAAGRPLRLLTASIDRDAAAVARYMQQQRFTFPVTLDSAALRKALTARQVIPLTCCIDRGGVLREVIAGEMFEEDVLGLLKYAG